MTLHSDRTVDGLKKAIKQERGNDLKDIDAVKLTLYKVLIVVFRHTALSLLLLVARTPDSRWRKHDWRAEEQGLCCSRTTTGYEEVVHYIFKWCWGRSSTHFGAKTKYVCYTPSVIVITIHPSHRIATADQQPTKWRRLDIGDNEEGQIDRVPGECQRLVVWHSCWSYALISFAPILDICLLHTDNANLPPVFFPSRRLNLVPLTSGVICACFPQAVYSQDQSSLLLFTNKSLTRGLSWCVVPRIVCPCQY